MGPIVAVLLLITLILLFILSIHLNAKTPRPFEITQISEKCESCNVGCIHNPNLKSNKSELDSEDCSIE